MNLLPPDIYPPLIVPTAFILNTYGGIDWPNAKDVLTEYAYTLQNWGLLVTPMEAHTLLVNLHPELQRTNYDFSRTSTERIYVDLGIYLCLQSGKDKDSVVEQLWEIPERKQWLEPTTQNCRIMQRIAHMRQLHTYAGIVAGGRNGALYWDVPDATSRTPAWPERNRKVTLKTLGVSLRELRNRAVQIVAKYYPQASDEYCESVAMDLGEMTGDYDSYPEFAYLTTLQRSFVDGTLVKAPAVPPYSVRNSQVTAEKSVRLPITGIEF